MCIWSLDELEKMILPGLGRLGGELRKKIIKIAEINDEPAMVYDLAEAMLRNCGYDPTEAVSIARSVSWLTVARRDKQEERGFERILQNLMLYNSRAS